MPFEVLEAPASSILSKTTGFIAEAGFTHSLTPARNCTFGCTYCYVPTMRIYGGLKPEDWRHWGQFTTFKSNAPELLRRQLREDQVIYCSPLVDPYQPAEESELMMPRILDELLARPPKVFVIQTRGPLIVRDIPRLIELSQRTTLRVSFSITTNHETVRKLYEPHCATIDCRLKAIRELRARRHYDFRHARADTAVRSRRAGGHRPRRDGSAYHRRCLAHSIGEAARRNHARSRVCDQPESRGILRGWSLSFSAT